MIYLVTETEIYNGESESHTFLSDRKVLAVDRKNYKLKSIKVGKEDVTSEMIANAIDSEMENSNYHDMVGFGNFLVKQLSRHLSDDKVKDILWDIVSDKGFGPWRF